MLEGHSFIVGAAVSLGGRDMKAGINIYRFANRIPLLFEVQLQRFAPNAPTQLCMWVLAMHATQCRLMQASVMHTSLVASMLPSCLSKQMSSA